MSRVDIMTDIETLGTSPDSTVFQVSAIAFDIETGALYSDFSQTIDIEKEELICDGNTIKWWLNTDKELLHKLLTSEDLMEGQFVFSLFRSWILGQTEDQRDIYLWANGIKFDSVMIDSQMKKYGLEYPIFYRNDRDVRTILELASVKSGLSEREIKDSVTDENEVKHDAYDDCMYQIRLVRKCWNMLTK